jgi:hypothetical protein
MKNLIFMMTKFYLFAKYAVNAEKDKTLTNRWAVARSLYSKI